MSTPQPNLDFAGLVGRTVPLVAELFATLASRDPLRMSFADIAGKTILDIVDTLRADGLSQEAIAASLDMSITGFRGKMRRLEEAYRSGLEDGQDERPRTLLERVYAVVDEEGTDHDPVTWIGLEQRFRGVKRDTLGGVLHHLVQYGLLSVSGRGNDREYRVVPRRRPKDNSYLHTSVLLYREGPLSVADASARLGIPEATCAAHIETLEAQKCLQRVIDPDGTVRYRVLAYHIPVGEREGFETALWDHLRVVIRAICKKVRAQRYKSGANDLTGGGDDLQLPPPGRPPAPRRGVWVPVAHAGRDGALAQRGQGPGGDLPAR